MKRWPVREVSLRCLALSLKSYICICQLSKATMPDRAYFVTIAIKAQGYLAQLLALHSQVGKGISAQASHRTVLETLASHGSSNSFSTCNSSPCGLVNSFNKLANPLASPSLQRFHHYYELVRHPYQHRYLASLVLPTCAFHLASNKDFPSSI